MPRRSSRARWTSTCGACGPSSATKAVGSRRSPASATGWNPTAEGDVADGLIRAVRRRIAVKLTLTLLGFVAITVLAAGLYLNHALERLAVESLESRLATAAALLHDDARAQLAPETSPVARHEFALRASRRG